MPESRVSQKILVLGGTRGIGLGVTRELLKQGHQVFSVGRGLHELEILRAEFPSDLKTAFFDLTEDQDPNIYARWSAQSGPFDVVFFNSGVAEDRGLKDWPVERKTLDVNIRGVTEFLFQVLAEHRQSKKSCTLAFNTSVAGLQGLRQAPLYSASKAYLIRLLEGLRGQAAHTEPWISYVDIRPGFVDTPMAGGNFWKSSVPKASEQIVDAFFKKKRVAYISNRWRLVGFLMQLIPSRIFERF